MAEATLTEVNCFTLLPGVGGGAKMIVLRAQIDDGETITTDLHQVLAAIFQAYADVAAAYHLAAASAHPSGGAITMSCGAVDDYADDTGKNYYGIIIGY